MRVNEENMDRALELSLKDLRKNLGKPGGVASEKVNKIELLAKARAAFREGKLSLLEAGNLESRLNKGLSLKSEHRVALGLGPAKIEGLESPRQSSPAARMSSQGAGQPGGSAAQIPTGTPLQENATVTAMLAKEKMIQTFQNMAGVVIKVSGSEILAKVRELVKKGAMTLTRAGDLERMVNTGAPVRPEVLRELFSI